MGDTVSLTDDVRSDRLRGYRIHQTGSDEFCDVVARDWRSFGRWVWNVSVIGRFRYVIHCAVRHES